MKAGSGRARDARSADILACPDVDRLQFITPWRSSIDWPHSVTIEKRYGNRFDRGATKIREKLK
jgi:hypothetical protein